jgi:hypothetical protein
LVHDNKRGAASLEPPPDAYGLAEARMKSVGDACFSLLFASKNPACPIVPLQESRPYRRPTRRRQLFEVSIRSTMRTKEMKALNQIAKAY